MSESDLKVRAGTPAKDEERRKEKFVELFKSCPIPENELLFQLGLFMKRKHFSRLLYIQELYQKILNVHGVVMEFGVRWGQNLALFESLRGIYEPYNYSRKIIGFDTFEGFPSVHAKDGSDTSIREGSYSVTEGYENFLSELLELHEQESPIGHIKKFELVKGDATVESANYLERNPHTIVALAYFDMDVYEPTLKCLEAIRPYLTKGSVLGFDELAAEWFPGETVALREALGLDSFRIQRVPYMPHCAFLVIE